MHAKMETLDATLVSASCAPCGHEYHVTFRQIALSQDLMDEGCVTTDERECLPLAFCSLAEREDVERARRGLPARNKKKRTIMPEEKHASNAPEVDTRVLDYVSRAPMTYPVPFHLLPKWPPTLRRPETQAR